MKKITPYLQTEFSGYILLIVCITVSRLLMYKVDAMADIGNFTPIGALALFGGAIYRNYKSYLLPLTVLWISDLVLNRYIYFGEWRLFYDQFYWTYGAFILMAFTGKYVIKKINVRNIATSAIIITFIHWIVTDFGVWLGGTLYPKDIQGLWMCLLAAIPYELYFLGGTAIFSSLLFGMDYIFGKNISVSNRTFSSTTIHNPS